MWLPLGEAGEGAALCDSELVRERGQATCSSVCAPAGGVSGLAGMQARAIGRGQISPGGHHWGQRWGHQGIREWPNDRGTPGCGRGSLRLSSVHSNAAFSWVRDS